MLLLIYLIVVTPIFVVMSVFLSDHYRIFRLENVTPTQIEQVQDFFPVQFPDTVCIQELTYQNASSGSLIEKYRQTYFKIVVDDDHTTEEFLSFLHEHTLSGSEQKGDFYISNVSQSADTLAFQYSFLNEYSDLESYIAQHGTDTYSSLQWLGIRIFKFAVIPLILMIPYRKIFCACAKSVHPQ